MPVKIALNLLSVDPKRQIGVETFARRVVGGMKLRKDSEIHIALQNSASVEDVLGKLFIECNPKFDFSSFRVRGMTQRLVSEIFRLGLLFYGSDIVFSVNNFGPFFGKRGQKRIIVIHDVWFIDKGYEGSWWKKFAFLILMKLQVRRSDQVVTVSEFSKSAIMRTLAVSGDRIKVIKNCLDSGIAAIGLTSSGHYQSYDMRGIREDRYVLLIGSDRPNKNVKRVIQAYGQFLQSESKAPSIRIVGVYSSKFINECKNSCHPDYQHKFIFDGYVERYAYERLIERSIGVIFASLYEGFGIPVIEAISKNKRCVVSARSVCAEIAGFAGIQVNGLMVDDIERGIKELIEHEIPLSLDEIEEIVGEFMDCNRQSSELGKLLQK